MAFESLSERLQNAIKMFRGAGKITEDDLKTCEKDVQDATDKFIKEIDTHTAAKEKEIMTV